MKTFSFPFLLMASVAFVLVGCSDNPGPTAPTDQSAQASASLEKLFTTPFTGSDYPIPPYILDPGVVKEVGQNRIVLGLKMQERWECTSDLMDGTWIDEVNGVQDKVTGEGEVHGKVLLTPFKDVGGGVWEGRYQGKIVQSGTPGIWKCSLSGVGHGKGGTIHGMKYTVQVDLKVFGFPATGWVGTLKGTIMSH
jgi:hypothetical protein